MVVILIIILILTVLFLISKKKRSKKTKKKTKLIFTTIINKTQIKILAMQLDTQEFVDAMLALENSADQSKVDATFANIVLTSSDPTIFTADTDVNADGTLDIVGVAVGTASLHVAADATYTDPNTQAVITANKTADIAVTISAPPPGAINTDLVVTFDTPQPTPVAAKP